MEGRNLPLVLFPLCMVLFAWWYFARRSTNSVLHNLPGPSRRSFWTGNLPEYLSRHGTEFQRHVALDYGLVSKIHGVMGASMAKSSLIIKLTIAQRVIPYIADPKALYTIMIKEEHIFQESESFLIAHAILLGSSLLSTVGDAHRRQRKLLNPAFSTTHMRSMLPIFYDVVHRLRDAISAQVKGGPREIDMLNWLGRTALELIGQGGLGYSFDPLVEDVQNTYGNTIKSFFANLQALAPLRFFVPYLPKLGPAWFRRRLAEMVPQKHVQNLITITDIMSANSRTIYESKKAALREGDQAVGEGKDIMSIFMRANTATSDADRLPEDELIAQMSTLVMAATDTTSNTLARMLEILAARPDVQDKLRREVLDAGAGIGVSYDELDQLPFLDSFCRETLRLYPPVLILFREAKQDTVLALSEPIIGANGRPITELPIAKGTEVMVGVLGCNTSRALWGEDALEWKPERWLSPLPPTVTKNTIPGVYSNMMTFLGGKRACIGFKFSEMEMKVVLSVLLSNFRFHLTDKPIEWNVAPVRYPTVGKASDVPQLPLKVELFKS
ncbi:uncharacterized protein FIBRA_04796 [Fibroporia radiculosa]|uniref:Cytochrome P450 n=1 Tax=Fibroporia radiculosa TaxID=599839 RepID=J4GPU1_9APHY|nr:uncharacterized protein FIBRA_04796 [Fibroporia radiculosa]CCM02690.1 predicted protein [Fibroporia radiculosa]